MKQVLFLPAALAVLPSVVLAAPTDNGMPAMDHSQMDHAGMQSGVMGHAMVHSMPATTDLATPMAREGSGTAWLPDSSPMYMAMKMRGRDHLMLHGTVYPRYTSTGSDRDVSVAGKGGVAGSTRPPCSWRCWHIH